MLVDTFRKTKSPGSGSGQLVDIAPSWGITPTSVFKSYQVVAKLATGNFILLNAVIWECQRNCREIALSPVGRKKCKLILAFRSELIYISAVVTFPWLYDCAQSRRITCMAGLHGKRWMISACSMFCSFVLWTIKMIDLLAINCERDSRRSNDLQIIRSPAIPSRSTDLKSIWGVIYLTAPIVGLLCKH